MSDDRLTIVKMQDDNVKEDDETPDPYSWYSGTPETTIVGSSVVNQIDCRKQGGIATGCKAKMWQECKYGKKPKSSANFCYYLTFGEMCYKVTGTDGKEIN